MKTCRTCRHDLPSSSFGRCQRTSDGLATQCRACANAYLKDHYAANKPAYLRKAREWEARRLAAIREAKNKPCADCGHTFHFSAMDFDHAPDAEKLFTVSAGHKRGIAAVLAEIAKCEVVCANCHRVRTFLRRGHQKARGAF